MQESIEKLSNTTMTSPLIHVHANTYFVSKVCFGCEIFDTSERQEKKLKSTFEMPLVWKLNLGSKFPRKVFHSRVTEMGISMMEPRIAIEVLAKKICTSHQRMKS